MSSIGEIEHRARDAAARVVDPDVEATERADRGVAQRFDFGAIGDVGLHGDARGDAGGSASAATVCSSCGDARRARADVLRRRADARSRRRYRRWRR